MPHVDPTRMVELALGNDVSPDDISALRHIAVCERCREELSLMTRVVTAARSVEESDLPADPPRRVWRRITRELAGPDEAAPPPPAVPLRGLAAVPAGSRHTSRSPGSRRRRHRLACGLLTGVLIVWWRSRKRPPRPSGPAADHPPV